MTSALGGGTLITPSDGALATHSIDLAPELGDVHTPEGGNRVTVTAGGVMAVYDKGPQSRVVTLSWLGLTAAELEALRTYIDTVLDGAIEPFTLQYGARTNLLTNTRDMSDLAVWEESTGTGVYTNGAYEPTELGPHGTSHGVTSWDVSGDPGDASAALQQESFDGLGVSLNDVVGGQVWYRADSAPGAALELQIRCTNAIAGLTLSLSPTTSWQLARAKATVGSAQATALRWHIRRASGTFPNFKLYLAEPALWGRSVGALPEYQEVPGDDPPNALVGYRFLSPALTMAERELGVWDVSASLLRVG